jgi:hypothetical protein
LFALGAAAGIINLLAFAFDALIGKLVGLVGVLAMPV